MSTVVASYESGLISYARALVRDLEAARDIVQDAFLKLWVEIPPPPEDHIKPWLITVCRNSAYDRLRRNGMIREKQDELLSHIPNFVDSTAEQFEWRDSGKVLEQLKRNLSAAQLEVLRLKFSEDLSYKEISKITGHSVNHVGVVIHQAITKMRESMKEYEKGGEYDLAKK